MSHLNVFERIWWSKVVQFAKHQFAKQPNNQILPVIRTVFTIHLHYYLYSPITCTVTVFPRIPPYSPVFPPPVTMQHALTFHITNLSYYNQVRPGTHVPVKSSQIQSRSFSTPPKHKAIYQPGAALRMVMEQIGVLNKINVSKQNQVKPTSLSSVQLEVQL